MRIKTFLFRLLLCLLAIIVLDCISGYVFRALYKTAGDKFAKEVYERDEMKADILLMGSSKCVHGYMPQCFKDTLGLEAYNCGQRGNGIIYTYGRLQTVFTRYTPRIIVVDLIQNFDILKNDNTRYLYYLKYDYGQYPALDTLFHDCDRTMPYKMLLQSYRYNSMICDLILNSVFRNRGRFYSDGFMPIDGKVADLRLENENSNVRISPDPIKLKYLRKLAKDKPTGCTIFFVLSPSYELPFPGFVSIVKEIAESSCVQLLDYSKDERFLGKGELFSDGAHLNVEGARCFSSIVAHDIKLYMKREHEIVIE